MTCSFVRSLSSWVRYSASFKSDSSDPPVMTVTDVGFTAYVGSFRAKTVPPPPHPLRSATSPMMKYAYRGLCMPSSGRGNRRNALFKLSKPEKAVNQRWTPNLDGHILGDKMTPPAPRVHTSVFERS